MSCPWYLFATGSAKRSTAREATSLSGISLLLTMCVTLRGLNTSSTCPPSSRIWCDTTSTSWGGTSRKNIFPTSG
eukprot:CAMPEP_0114610754 /NCGR_PEP_ID=MMETSP0168-20121206/3763_1 /TAXON_ID=95228 ORGANISM="Vannella sp., Strain DIVA3 517/6/12" /NCGR_SAMPLE_ID=MMETSP0168 /ASSEMBLY_ACC=CAM_ASM_000044 /LENGTH=74 /DNA_ID=CAMNT_0001821705 /DNA_START=617 /DNA_END=841 /DNA_ORIENTATION=-